MLRALLLTLATLALAASAQAQTGFSDICYDDNVSAVRIHAGWWVDSIELVCGRDTPQRMGVRGGTGGTLSTLTLRPGEKIIGISGTYGGPSGDYIYALQIHTNQGVSERYGEGGSVRGQRTFDFRVGDGRSFAGFTGRAGNFLERLGLVSYEMM